MFNQEKKIVFITKSEIEGIVVAGTPPKIKERFKLNWDTENLTEALGQIMAKLKTNQVLLLLGQDLVYTLPLTLEEAEQKGESREQMILEQAQKQIPEVLTDGEWGYAEMLTDDRAQQALVYAPVHQKFQIISKAFHQLGSRVEKIEPEEISKLKNPDPILGIALNQNSDDKIREVVELKLLIDSPISPEAVAQPTTSNKKYLLALLAMVFAGVIVAVIIDIIIIIGTKR